MNEPTRVGWAGTVPGADTDQYSLFSTCSTGVADDATHHDNVIQNLNRWGGCGGNFFAQLGIRKFVLSLKYTATFTLNSYYSMDRGVTWLQEKTEVIPAPTAGFTLDREWLVNQYPDWRLDVVNGGGSQAAAWVPTMLMETERAVG